MKARTAFALAAVLAILGLLGILAVATLAVTTRLQQGASLAERDHALAGAASAALTVPLRDWRTRALSTISVCETRTIGVTDGGLAATTATVTRLGAELFWLVAEAVALDGSRRRENLVVRLVLPPGAPLAGLVLSGDATLSRSIAVDSDPAAGCSPNADVIMRPAASLTSSDGALPPFRLLRDAGAADSSHAVGVDATTLEGLERTADLTVAAGGSITIGPGITHATGDLTVTGGSAGGILIVDGALTIAGPVAFDGLVIARELRVTASGSVLRGGVRVAPGYGYYGSVQAPEGLRLVPSACAVQSALSATVRPRPVAGRRWSEMY
jgi:hypothetical protein